MKKGWAATLIVDASYCSQTKAGGYGFRIASERGKRSGSGILQGRVTNSMVAEMQAVVNVLWIARNEEKVLPGDEVLIMTDCVAAINGLEGRRVLSKEEEVIRKEYLKLNNHIYVELRHIRGHVKSDKKRYVAHNNADEAAKKQMKLQRKKFERGTHADF